MQFASGESERKRLWGENVAAARRTLGLSQPKLAAAAGCTQQTISSIERGEYAPRDGLKVRLAEALRQDVRQLFPLTRSAA